MTQKKVALSLFWRTFFLLLLLLAGGVLAWVLTLRAVDQAVPEQQHSARRLASMVRVIGEALHLSDRGNRPALIKSLSVREGLVLLPRTVTDVWTSPQQGDALGPLAADLRRQLGPELLVATRVNGTPGLWLGFVVDREAWWLQTATAPAPVSYTHLRAHETVLDLVCRLLPETKKHHEHCVTAQRM